MELSIDPEFRSWIMQLREDEYAGLRENIRQYGCTQPLDVWQGIIIDGHNRYKICKELGIEFQVHEMEFSSRGEAKNYMIRNQLARRNVTTEQRDYLMGKIYAEQKNSNGGLREPVHQNDAVRKSEQIGEQFKVGSATVERAERFALAVDTIAENCGRDIRDKILSGDVEVTKTDVLRLANLPRSEQQKAVSHIRTGMKGKHALDRIWGEPQPQQEEKEEPDTILIPCANPRCERDVRITRKQYKEFVGVFPEKYGHVTVVHCSKECRNAHMARLSHAIKC